MTLRQELPTIPAPYALPVSFAMFLAVGTVAAALHGHLPATGVLIACAVIAGVTSFAADPAAFVLLAGIGWLTTVGFSRPPYAQLHLTGTIATQAAIVISATSGVDSTAQRMMGHAADRKLDRYVAGLRRDAVIVTHQIPVRLIRGHYLGLTPEQMVGYEHPHAGIMRLSGGVETYFGE